MPLKGFHKTDDCWVEGSRGSHLRKHLQPWPPRCHSRGPPSTCRSELCAPAPSPPRLCLLLLISHWLLQRIRPPPIWRGPTLLGKLERRLHTQILSRKNQLKYPLQKLNYFSLLIVSHAREPLRVYHGVTCRRGNCPVRRESRAQPFHPTAKQTFPPDAPVPQQYLLKPTSLFWLPYYI